MASASAKCDLPQTADPAAKHHLGAVVSRIRNQTTVEKSSSRIRVEPILSSLYIPGKN